VLVIVELVVEVSVLVVVVVESVVLVVVVVLVFVVVDCVVVEVLVVMIVVVVVVVVVPSHSPHSEQVAHWHSNAQPCVAAIVGQPERQVRGLSGLLSSSSAPVVVTVVSAMLAAAVVRGADDVMVVVLVDHHPATVVFGARVEAAVVVASPMGAGVVGMTTLAQSRQVEQIGQPHLMNHGWLFALHSDLHSRA